MQDQQICRYDAFFGTSKRGWPLVHMSVIEVCLFFPNVGGIGETVQQYNRRCSSLAVVGAHEVQSVGFEALSFTRHGGKLPPRSAYCDPCCTLHVVQLLLAAPKPADLARSFRHRLPDPVVGA